MIWQQIWARGDLLAPYTRVEAILIQYFVQSVSRIVSMKWLFVFASALILYFYTVFKLKGANSELQKYDTWTVP